MKVPLIKPVINRRLHSIFGSRYFNLSLRLGIGIVFLLAGIGKLSGAEFIDTVSTLKILPFVMIQPVGAVLPWLELVLGICFILGIFPGIISAISLPLASAFVIINIFNLQHGLTSPCTSCFGNLLVLNSRDALIIDVFLLLAALRLTTLERHFMSLDSLRTKKVSAL